MKEMAGKQLVSVAACVCAAVVLLQSDRSWIVKLEKFNISQELKKRKKKKREAGWKSFD